MTFAILAPRHLLQRYLDAGWTLVGPVIGHHGAYSYLLTKATTAATAA